MLVLKGVQKVFNKGQINENHALKDIELVVEKGDFISIIGSNGAGKSTLLNCVAGTFPIEGGEILLDGKDITNWKAHQCAYCIGRVFQDPMLGTAAGMSIQENLSLAIKRGKKRGLRLGINKKIRYSFFSSIQELGLGLEKRLNEEVNLLSGGQRQALTLLMATLGNPQILLLDEHTASLDPKTAADIISLTNKIIEEEGLTVLMVTHDMKQALELGNRTIMMDKGEIILDIKEPVRGQLTMEDLIEKFSQVRGQRLVDDRILLG